MSADQRQDRPGAQHEMIEAPRALSEREHQVQVGDVRLYCREWPGTKPAILLLHANQMNSHVWDPVVQAASLPNRILAPDQRHHGRSDYPSRGYALNDYLADDLGLLDNFGVERAVVVGLSTGANLALLMATRYPKRVIGVVAANPAFTFPPGLIDAMQANLRRNFRFSSFEAARAAVPFNTHIAPSVLDEFSSHSFRRLPDGEYEWLCSMEGVARTYAQIAGNTWEQYELACPTLIVRGPDSPVFHEADMARLQHIIPGSRAVTVPDSGQLLTLDQPSEFARLLRSFLASVASVVRSS